MKMKFKSQESINQYVNSVNPILTGDSKDIIEKYKQRIASLGLQPFDVDFSIGMDFTDNPTPYIRRDWVEVVGLINDDQSPCSIHKSEMGYFDIIVDFDILD
ncbi:goF mRNA metabolism modulator [Aeromonas phage CC2]|uniref:Uncharacterized protein n=1 Tax=Aeromonas phage CC2 TaxID=1204516 RepID=I6XGL4_9CAUD|nr:goF mRNA metabolism modulator [Aeromonas phage CC2]AFN39206.1 hypothetical protein CC2_072 [Aeromonas phage CC2]